MAQSASRLAPSASRSSAFSDDMRRASRTRRGRTSAFQHVGTPKLATRTRTPVTTSDERGRLLLTDVKCRPRRYVVPSSQIHLPWAVVLLSTDTSGGPACSSSRVLPRVQTGARAAAAVVVDEPARRCTTTTTRQARAGRRNVDARRQLRAARCVYPGPRVESAHTAPHRRMRTQRVKHDARRMKAGVAPPRPPHARAGK